MSRLFLYLALTVAALSLPASALAWVPPGDRIVEEWASAYRPYKKITLTGTARQGAREIPFVATRDAGGVTVLESGEPVTDATVLAVWQLLLRPREQAETWRDAGTLSFERTGFARSGEQIAYTLGVEGEQKPGVQIWVDRRRLTPLRATLPDSVRAGAMVQYEGYEESSNHAFPQRVIVRAPGGYERTWAVKSVEAVR